MTRRSTVILISSALLAASIIVSSILLIFEVRDTPAGLSTILISCGLILVSILSVVFIYFVKIKKRPDERKLDESYYREYEIVKDAIMNSSLPTNTKKGIVEDVLELMATAQFQGKSVQDAIGDATSFAKGILDACTKKSRSAVMVLMNGIMAFLLFTLFTSGLLWLEDLSAGFFNQRIDIFMLLFFAILSFALIPFIRQMAMRRRAWAHLLPLAAGLAFVGTAELLRAFLYDSHIVKTLLDGSINMIPNLAVLIAILLAILILILVKVVFRRQHMSSI
jgi:DNA-binding ferritin-like protein (Dps family)